ncbi:MAG TPA: hypothetical protein PKA82_01270 [Pyrinomonadaceae bacterium]|nr:hypothetical protein [Pyrinomonadaceae bacterium]
MSSKELPTTKAATLAIGAVLLLALSFVYSNYRAQRPDDTISLSPTEMSERVTELLRSLGFRDRPAERWSEYRFEQAGEGKQVVRFVERQSLDHFDTVIDGAKIVPVSALATGERRVVLDSNGRLVELAVRFPKTYDSSEPAAKFDWNVAFTAAGLELATFTPIDTSWTPSAAADTYSAWTGKSPDDSSVSLRVEASTFRGQLTNFLIVYPWYEPDQHRPAATTTSDRVLIAFSLVAFAVIVFFVLRLVWTHTAEPSSNTRPAYFLAVVTFVPILIGLISTTPQVAAFDPLLERLTLSVLIALAGAMLVWLVYMSSASLISTSHKELFSSWKNTSSKYLFSRIVGNDVLYGLFAGAFIAVNIATRPMFSGRSTDLSDNIGPLVLSPFGATFLDIGWAVLAAVVVFGAFAMLLWIVRMRSIAGITLFALLSFIGWLYLKPDDTELVVLFIVSGVSSIVVARFGLLSMVIAAIVAVTTVNAMLVMLATNSATIPIALALGAAGSLLIIGVMFSLKGQIAKSLNGQA